MLKTLAIFSVKITITQYELHLYSIRLFQISITCNLTENTIDFFINSAGGEVLFPCRCRCRENFTSDCKIRYNYIGNAWERFSDIKKPQCVLWLYCYSMIGVSLALASLAFMPCPPICADVSGCGPPLCVCVLTDLARSETIWHKSSRILKIFCPSLPI